LIGRLAVAAMLLASALPANAGELSTQLHAWVDSLEIDPRILQELDRFSADEGSWPEDTAERLTHTFRDRVRDDVGRAVARIENGDVEPYVKVDFLSPEDFARGREETSDKRGEKFEKGVIRTEQLAFFPHETTAPLTALELFVDPAFRMQTSSRIETIYDEDGLSCIRTKGMWGLLDPTFSCNRIHILAEAGLAAEHSQVVANPGGEDYQTVYFKESLKVLIPAADGLALYYINYTRSAKLGALKKKFGRGKIEDSQVERAAALRELLAARRESGPDPETER
jgi:hypothetical protein